MKLWDILGWSIVILFLLIILNIPVGADRKTCPYNTTGNPNATVHIQYFGNPFCVYCLIEEPILDRLEKKYPSDLYLQRYDDRYCTEEVKQFGITSVPGFVFTINTINKTEKIHIGFLSTDILEGIVQESIEQNKIERGSLHER